MSTAFFFRRSESCNTRVRILAAVVAVLTCASAHAQQAQSMEERLRAQLRVTTAQLQEAQNELAALKAGQTASSTGAAAPGEVAELSKGLAQSRSQLESERRARQQLDQHNRQLQQQAQSLVERANAQIAQYRNAYDELLKLAKTAEAERRRVEAEAGLQKTSVQQCEAKNAQLYAIGQEILRAYETVDFGDVLASRQPFAAKTRARYEQIAEQYGDKLYESRFDARAVTAPVTEAPSK